MIPGDVYKCLDRDIVGNEDAKRELSLIAWNATMGRRSVSMLIGRTGSGKTALIESLKKAANERGFAYDVIVIDASGLSSSGYKGESIWDALRTNHVEGTPGFIHQICVLDEADKALMRNVGASGTEYNKRVCADLLKLMEAEGRVIRHTPENASLPPFEIDTRNVSFILAGAFEDMFNAIDRRAKASSRTPLGFMPSAPAPVVPDGPRMEDFVAFGMTAELYGRMQRIITLDTPDRASMARIAEKTAESLSAEYGFKVTVSPECSIELADEALANGSGARYIRREMLKDIDRALFFNPYPSEVAVRKGGETKERQ